MSPVLAAAVIAAGVSGALLRFVVVTAAGARGFPWAVLMVNVLGSAVAGVVLGLATTAGMDAELRVILLSGFCGGLTTFSTFSVETIELVLDGKVRPAVLNVGLTLALGVGAAALGFGAVSLLG
ncbi:CrcB family protein [Salinibacterium sp.]|uniref:fluoride efflux transporter FluC n=1 Tax=Salinibacterium sp. TaxID=1915057 RepID=UPI00286C4B5C|nr:CrcB family protein [Salinibacterium sp.]